MKSNGLGMEETWTKKLSYFKNIDNIKDASIEEICNVDGINLSFAKKIKDIFDEIADKQNN